MTTYLVYRTGSNSSNQSMCDEMPLCIVEAASRNAACEIAEFGHSVYGNQSLRATPKSKASRQGWRSVVENDEYYRNSDEIVKVEGILYSVQPLINYG
jgi:uncharacterized caspase-like protein